ncbi:MAG: hypothetical protein CSA23_03455 [Deltaproteobacteria bacterium]|nr:MAG: hypothetical protein CSA23_03455 [Deltaproteobacteria bacterium]
MTSILPECPICKGHCTLFKTGGPLQNYKCLECGHLFLHPPISTKTSKALYSKWDYWVTNRETLGTTTFDEQSMDGLVSSRSRTLKQLNAIPERPSSFLEIGCCEGALVNFLPNMGHRSMGCEINPEIVKTAKKVFPIDIVATDFADYDFGTNKFDTVLAFHVFEHFHNPKKAVEKCASLLNKNGKIVLEVPFGENEFCDFEHPHLFSKKSFQILLQKSFKDIVIIEISYKRESDGVQKQAFLISGTIKEYHFLPIIKNKIKFIVLCGNSMLQFFSQKEGFAGAIYIDAKSNDDQISIDQIPDGIHTIYIQNNKYFLGFAKKNMHKIEDLNIQIFSVTDFSKEKNIQMFEPFESDLSNVKEVTKPLSRDDISEYRSISGIAEKCRYDSNKADNLDRMKSDLLEQAEIVSSYPSRIWLESSTKCNFACRMCYNTNVMEGVGQDMSLSVFNKIKTSLFPVLTAVDLQGQGEPLMAEHFDSFYESAIEYGIRPAMVTNGSLLSRKRIEQFVNDGVQLIISMDGVTPETYGLLRPTYKVEKLRDKIDYGCRLRDEADNPAGFSMNFICIATNKTAHGIPQLIEYAISCKAGFIMVTALEGDFLPPDIQQLIVDPIRDRNKLYYLEAARMMAEANGLSYSMPLKYELPSQSASCKRQEKAVVRQAVLPRLLQQIAEDKKPGNTAYPGICTMPWSHCWVNNDGTVRPCCIHSKPMGNLLKQTFDEIWNGPEYQELRRTINSENPPPICSKCSASFGINSRRSILPDGMIDI